MGFLAIYELQKCIKYMCTWGKKFFITLLFTTIQDRWRETTYIYIYNQEVSQIWKDGKSLLRYPFCRFGCLFL